MEVTKSDTLVNEEHKIGDGWECSAPPNEKELRSLEEVHDSSGAASPAESENLEMSGREVVGTLKSITLALTGMQVLMEKMQCTMEKTDSAVRKVTNQLRQQGSAVTKLQRRVDLLESAGSSPSPAAPASELASPPPPPARSHTAPEPAAVRKLDPGDEGPLSPYAASSTRESCAFRAESSESRRRQHPGRRRTVVAAVVSNTRKGALRPPRTVSQLTAAEATPPDVPPSCDERLAALGLNLLKASQAGHLKDVQKLLEAGADPNFTYGSKWTPLHRAAAKSHAGIVSTLLERDAYVHAATCYGLTPLHIAAYHDFSGRCVSLLLGARADMSRRDRQGWTPLHYAAESGNLVAVRALRAAGASQNAKDNRGRAPFQVTHTACIRRLLRSCSRSEWARSYVCRFKRAKAASSPPLTAPSPARAPL